MINPLNKSQLILIVGMLETTRRQCEADMQALAARIEEINEIHELYTDLLARALKPGVGNG